MIIVSWNVRDLLRACLRSVYGAGGLANGRFEVIVVDNASQDGSVAMLEREFPQVLVVANRENVGFAAAHNQVLPSCRGGILLLLNPDTLVLPGALGILVQRLRQIPEAGIVGCRLLNGDGTLQRWTGGAFPTVWGVARHYLFLGRLLPFCYHTPPLYLERDLPQETEVDWVTGAALVIWRDLVGKQVFNADYFMYGEDMELCRRVKLGGKRVFYSPSASIIHYHGASIRQQRGAIRQSSLKGLRHFYTATQGENWLWLIDLLTIIGFLLRFLLFGFGRLFGQAGAAEKAASSWSYLRLAFKVRGTRTKSFE